MACMGCPLMTFCLLAADLEASQATWKVQLEQPQIPSQHIILVRHAYSSCDCIVPMSSGCVCIDSFTVVPCFSRQAKSLLEVQENCSMPDIQTALLWTCIKAMLYSLLCCLCVVAASVLTVSLLMLLCVGTGPSVQGRLPTVRGRGRGRLTAAQARPAVRQRSTVRPRMKRLFQDDAQV